MGVFILYSGCTDLLSSDAESAGEGEGGGLREQSKRDGEEEKDGRGYRKMWREEEGKGNGENRQSRAIPMKTMTCVSFLRCWFFFPRETPKPTSDTGFQSEKGSPRTDASTQRLTREE